MSPIIYINNRFIWKKIIFIFFFSMSLQILHVERVTTILFYVYSVCVYYILDWHHVIKNRNDSHTTIGRIYAVCQISILSWMITWLTDKFYFLYLIIDCVYNNSKYYNLKQQLAHLIYLWCDSPISLSAIFLNNHENSIKELCRTMETWALELQVVLWYMMYDWIYLLPSFIQFQS